MDPFDILETATSLGVPTCLGGLLVWAAHQRAAAHRIWRRQLHDSSTDVRTFRCWVTASTVAGLL